MSNYIFVISLWEGCPHCVNFKTKVNASGKTSLEELKEKIAALGIEVKEVMKLNHGSDFDHEFSRLKGSWFPSFYLLNKKDWNEGRVNGYLMGGEINDGEISKTGTISTDPNKIVAWVKSIISPSDSYVSYESRLKQLKNDGRWQIGNRQ